jgi:predicted negative regulator of RcsB-dependent stress response
MLKRSLTLGEAIATFILLLGTVIGFYVNTQVRLSALEMRQNTYENLMNKADQNFEKVNDKLDRITEQIGSMRAEIATKKDK